jgi:DNA mismatch endonuclease (patch repair protein)
VVVTDIVDSMTRSRMMSSIRGKDTKPERSLRSALWRAGFRFRLHAKNLPGHPDVVLPKWRTVVFVHGCFWHAHSACRYFRVPRTRQEFWCTKFEANRARDKHVVELLIAAGWRVFIVWECSLRNHETKTIKELETLIWNSNEGSCELREDPASGKISVVALCS